MLQVQKFDMIIIDSGIYNDTFLPEVINYIDRYSRDIRKTRRK